MSKPASITSAPCTPAQDLYRFDGSTACDTEGAGDEPDLKHAPRRDEKPTRRRAGDTIEPRRSGADARARLTRMSGRLPSTLLPDLGPSVLEVETTRDGLKAEWSRYRRDGAKGARVDVLNHSATLQQQALEAKVSLATAQSGYGGLVGGDVAVLSGEAASKGDAGLLRIGAKATFVGGAVRVGASNPHDPRDEQARGGLSWGVGVEGRLHYSDTDKDGRREYGFGVDVGPITFDIKSETPWFTAAKVLLPGPPGSHEAVREAVQRLRTK